MTMFPDQIGKLIPRLGSSFDAEVVATARAIERTLSSAGLDWHDVVDALTPKQTIPLALARRDPKPAPADLAREILGVIETSFRQRLREIMVEHGDSQTLRRPC